VIASFGDRGTEAVFHGSPKGLIRRYPAEVARVAARKLDVVNAALVLSDLHATPGNRLEALKGELKGAHSIRVNERWRIVFRWCDGNAHEVRLVDYH
jgi:proteic killer suppression protein